MIEVSLYTNDGRFVTTVRVPPWQTHPEVYIWGDRIFLLRGNGRYEEALGVFVVPPVIVGPTASAQNVVERQIRDQRNDGRHVPPDEVVGPSASPQTHGCGSSVVERPVPNREVRGSTPRPANDPAADVPVDWVCQVPKRHRDTGKIVGPCAEGVHYVENGMWYCRHGHRGPAAS